MFGLRPNNRLSTAELGRGATARVPQLSLRLAEFVNKIREVCARGVPLHGGGRAVLAELTRREGRA